MTRENYSKYHKDIPIYGLIRKSSSASYNEVITYFDKASARNPNDSQSLNSKDVAVTALGNIIQLLNILIKL